MAARLSGWRALLLLDNAEHLMPEVASRIAELRDVPGPTLVVTSRERLQLQGEHVYSVPSLAEREAVELFLTRALALGSESQESESVAGALRAAGQPASGPRAGGRAYRRLLPRAARRALWRSASTCSRPGGTQILDSRRCAQPSSGRTTCSRPRSSGCSAPCPCSPVAARTRQPRLSATPIRTRCSHSSTRASSGGATSLRASGCSRRSTSSQLSGWRRRQKTPSYAADTPSTTSRSPFRPTSHRTSRGRCGTTSSSRNETTCGRLSPGRSTTTWSLGSSSS